MSITHVEAAATPERPRAIEHPGARRGPTRTLWLAVIVALVVGMAGGYLLRWGLSPSEADAPSLSDPAATAAPLVDRFFTLLSEKDVPGLESFLSPAFQVQRADGSAGTKAEELMGIDLSSFSVSDLVATQDGPVLVVRYLITAEGSIDGNPYAPGPAPRISVFVWDGSAWRLAAHSNFNPLNG